MKRNLKSAMIPAVVAVSLFSLAGCSTSTPATFAPTTNTVASGGVNATAPGNSTNSNATSSGNATPANAATSGNTTSANITTVGSGNLTVSTTVQNANPNKSLATAFPSIIQMAMNHLPLSILSWAYAPTMYPVSADGDKALFYQTMIDKNFAMSFPGR